MRAQNPVIPNRIPSIIKNATFSASLKILSSYSKEHIPSFADMHTAKKIVLDFQEKGISGILNEINEMITVTENW